MRPNTIMAIPIPDEKTFAKIQQLVEEIYYSRDACEPDKIYELDRLASPYPYMNDDRAVMRRSFDEYRSFKRQSKRAEAWSNVQSHAHKIAGLASIARRVNPPA
jgi:hypothetical protein